MMLVHNSLAPDFAFQAKNEEASAAAELERSLSAIETIAEKPDASLEKCTQAAEAIDQLVTFAEAHELNNDALFTKVVNLAEKLDARIAQLAQKNSAKQAESAEARRTTASKAAAPRPSAAPAKTSVNRTQDTAAGAKKEIKTQLSKLIAAVKNSSKRRERIAGFTDQCLEECQKIIEPGAQFGGGLERIRGIVNQKLAEILSRVEEWGAATKAAFDSCKQGLEEIKSEYRSPELETELNTAAKLIERGARLADLMATIYIRHLTNTIDAMLPGRFIKRSELEDFDQQQEEFKQAKIEIPASLEELAASSGNNIYKALAGAISNHLNTRDGGTESIYQLQHMMRSPVDEFAQMWKHYFLKFESSALELISDIESGELGKREIINRARKLREPLCIALAEINLRNETQYQDSIPGFAERKIYLEKVIEYLDADVPMLETLEQISSFAESAGLQELDGQDPEQSFQEAAIRMIREHLEELESRLDEARSL